MEKSAGTSSAKFSLQPSKQASKREIPLAPRWRIKVCAQFCRHNFSTAMAVVPVQSFRNRCGPKLRRQPEKAPRLSNRQPNFTKQPPMPELDESLTFQQA